jgi:glyoxylase-like metal-dependent hydrolase (beta-lactamase superfamily II)
MNIVKVLIQGYVNERNGAEFASSSTSLIVSDGINVIVDPGSDRERLLSALSDAGLTIGDIKFVVLTHTHPDHCLLAGLFEGAKVLDSDSIYGWDGSITGHDSKIPGTNIEILKTPGHDEFHCVVLVPTGDLGFVAIAGDLFWWPDGEAQQIDRDSLMNHPDKYEKDHAALVKSRELILQRADYVIPGHGKAFVIDKK